MVKNDQIWSYDSGYFEILAMLMVKHFWPYDHYTRIYLPSGQKIVVVLLPPGWLASVVEHMIEFIQVSALAVHSIASCCFYPF